MPGGIPPASLLHSVRASMKSHGIERVLRRRVGFKVEVSDIGHTPAAHII